MISAGLARQSDHFSPKFKKNLSLSPSKTYHRELIINLPGKRSIIKHTWINLYPRKLPVDIRLFNLYIILPV